MRTLLLCTAFTSGGALAFPQGRSYWAATGSCDAACRSEGHVPATAQIILIVQGQRVCGEVQQDYGAANANRRPSGKIAGRLLRGSVTIGYTDSFADPKYPGFASLQFSGKTLRWTTVMPTPIGYLHLDDFSFGRVQQLSTRLWRTDARQEISRICEEYFKDSGNNSIRDHLERQ